MLEDVDEGGIRPWHLVKPSDEPEPPRPRRGSLRGGERERAKAIPEIYLTRLLSMKVELGETGDGTMGSGWLRRMATRGTWGWCAASMRSAKICLTGLSVPSLPSGHTAEVCG